MHIVVTLKQVPDPNAARSALRIAADGKSLLPVAGANPIMNGYDANALEEALRLREIAGGSVTAISIGGDSAKDILRRALAMGADKALHVLGPTGIESDSWVIASLLSAVIRTLPASDLVLSGRQASDTDAGLCHMLLAAQLKIPAVSPVKGIRSGDGATLIVDRITDGGIQRLRVHAPAVFGVSNEINKPRSSSLKGVATAKRTIIPTVTAEGLGVDASHAGLQLRRLHLPIAAQSNLELIQAPSPEEQGKSLADRLHREGLL